MPGIAGIIRNGSRPGVEDDLHTMGTAMRHEAFYSLGQYVNDDSGLYITWTCHPGGYCDAAPIVSRNVDRILVFHGEHYDGSKNAATTSSSDLINLLNGDLELFLRSLNGWFCGVVVDLSSRRIILFNDRYGMGRVYIHEESDQFLFASEAKCLLKLRPHLRAIEPVALAQYMRFNCVLENKTLFKGVSLLPPGSSWVFEGNCQPARRTYFDRRTWEEQPPLSPDQFVDNFIGVVSRIVPMYLKGPHPVGLSVTAGLDTRMILAALADEAHPLRCYTFGGAWGETFDIRTGRRLAEINKSPFDAIRITDGFLKDFPRYAERSVYISDGTHDALGTHDVYFNEHARKIAPVRLTGKFGSEIVRVRKLIPTLHYDPNLLVADIAAELAKLGPLSDVLSRHPLSRVVFEEIGWYEFGRVAIEQSQLTLRTPYMDNELVRLMYRAPAKVRAQGEIQEQYVRLKSQQLSEIITNLGSLGTLPQWTNKLSYLIFYLLFKVEYTYLYATPHWLTRIDRSLERFRPEQVLAGRQKFEGYRIWLRTHFGDFLRDVLLRPNSYSAQFFNRAATEQVIARHLAGTHNYLNDINKMLTIELLCSSLATGR